MRRSHVEPAALERVTVYGSACLDDVGDEVVAEVEAVFFFDYLLDAFFFEDFFDFGRNHIETGVGEVTGGVFRVGFFDKTLDAAVLVYVGDA